MTTYLIMIAHASSFPTGAERMFAAAASFLSTLGEDVTREDVGEYQRLRRGEVTVTRIVAMTAPHALDAGADDRAKALENVLRQAARAGGGKDVEVLVHVRRER